MTKIIDNLDATMLQSLRVHLPASERLDLCVGYFSLGGWGRLSDLVDQMPASKVAPVRVLIGMVGSEQDSRGFSELQQEQDNDAETAFRLSRQVIREFHRQLQRGKPTRATQASLESLKRQIREKKVHIKVYLRRPLHAKLYLCHAPTGNPWISTKGFVGSSNLTANGLTGNGELNVDVLDSDATGKLNEWFTDRWEDPLSHNVDEEILDAIDESWASETPFSPYHIYLKMAYHLSTEARAGLAEFAVPQAVEADLMDFQAAALKIAARHLTRRGGVLIGDVVGLGKTLVGTALALLWREHSLDTALVICPKNLAGMWRAYSKRYGLAATVLPLTDAIKVLPNAAPHGLVLIDESHNLRNRGGKTYAAVRDYVARHDAKCILMSATPYNKDYVDLANQLRLFTDETRDLGIRPENHIRELKDNAKFLQQCKGHPSSLLAFEASDHPDDWRELMRLFLVRRTRSFIKSQYASRDEEGRPYLSFKDGRTFYFPAREVASVRYEVTDPGDPSSPSNSLQYVLLIGDLKLPRYGLRRYVNLKEVRTKAEGEAVQNLTRAGEALVGLTRSGLFKRLESSCTSFLLSVRRHLNRNMLFLYAIENGLPVPVGQTYLPGDSDIESVNDPSLFEGGWEVELKSIEGAREAYQKVAQSKNSGLTWIPARIFNERMANDLLADCETLQSILDSIGPWSDDRDAKAQALSELLSERHGDDKVLVFTEFSDTAEYLESYLQRARLKAVECVTGSSGNVASKVKRFSPDSAGAEEGESTPAIRVLVATDVISEGQNLQDANVVVNYDLPWAIIKLVQRAGRVDRLGQEASRIKVYSFISAEGIEAVLQLRARVRRRLLQNNEVIGSDEAFFEGDDVAPAQREAMENLFNENSTVLEDAGDADDDVDLSSYALAIWNDALSADSTLERVVPSLSDVVGATRDLSYDPRAVEGVLTYIRTANGTDSLVRVDATGQALSYSPLRILQTAACPPDTPSLPHDRRHHQLVGMAEEIARKQATIVSSAGALTGTRSRVYKRLAHFVSTTRDSLFTDEDLADAVEAIYERPLTEQAERILRQRIRDGASDSELADLVSVLHRDDGLCRVVSNATAAGETHIVCSVGLFSPPVVVPPEQGDHVES